MPLSPSLPGSSPTGLFAVPRTFEVLYTHLRLYDPCASAASLSLISCQLQCLFFKEILPNTCAHHCRQTLPMAVAVLQPCLCSHLALVSKLFRMFFLF